MKAENPAALRFILQDDIYLLQTDKVFIGGTRNEPAITPVTPAVTPVVIQPAVETPPVKLNYLGGHKKAFLIIVHYASHEHIADDHLTALVSILKRKDYTIADVAILNLATAAITDIDGLISYFNTQKLLILGKDALPANMDILPINQPAKVGEVKVLYSFSFDEMMSSTNNKKAFWDQMKNL